MKRRKRSVGIDGCRVAENIRIARVSAHMTQQDLADAMTAAGASTFGRVAVSMVEAGKRPVTIDEILALQRIFDRDLIYPDLGFGGRRP